MKSMMKRQGFTLVELSLSLVFIGVLSIIIVLIINNTVMAYQRGVVLNQINTVGMDLVDDMRAAVQGSPALDNKCGDDSECVSFTYKGTKIINNAEKNDVPLYGGVCTGRYTYIWKSGYLSDNDEMVKVNGEEFRLAKIKDNKRELCAKYMSMNDSEKNGVNFEIGDEGREELLAEENGLVLYDLHASKPAISTATGSAYYSVSFILGTKEGGADITATGDYCVPPKDANSNFNYCAINKFSFAAQAGGIKNEE